MKQKGRVNMENGSEPATVDISSVKHNLMRPEAVEVRRGMLTPKTGVELSALLERVATGGGFPERFKTKEARIAAYNLSQSLMGDRWQLCLNNIAVIKGQMTIFGELPGALAEQTKEVQEKEVFCIDAAFKRISVENKNLDAEPYAGVCVIQRKGRSKKEFTYTLEEAKKAGQYPAIKAIWKNGQRVGEEVNNDSPWMKFTKVMLMRKAMNLAVKFEFADALVGVPIAEYDFNEAPDLREVTDTGERTDVAKELNEAYSDKEQGLPQ
jgi:RecT family